MFFPIIHLSSSCPFDLCHGQKEDPSTPLLCLAESWQTGPDVFFESVTACRLLTGLEPQEIQCESCGIFA